MTEYGSSTYGGTTVTVESTLPRDQAPRAALGNLGMVRGDSLVKDIEVSLNGAPLDITLDRFSFTAKRSTEDTDAEAVIRKSTATTGFTVTNALLGQLQLRLLPADTLGLSGLVPTVLYYDLQIVRANGDVFTLSEGTLVVYPDSTIAA